MHQTVEVRNLRSGQVYTFVNEQTLTENIVNAIFHENKQVGNILDANRRSAVKADNKIVESNSTKTGRPFAFCPDRDLHAKYVI